MILFPLAIELAQSVSWDPQLQCHFELSATRETITPSPKNDGSFIVSSDPEKLGTFTELTTENLKQFIFSPGLAELLKEKLGGDFVFDLFGRCFPKPGHNFATIKSVSSLSSFYMSLEGRESRYMRFLQKKYPNNDSDNVLSMGARWNLTLDPATFFVELDLKPANTSVPENSPFHDTKTFTFFPKREPGTMELEWHPTKKGEQEKPDFAIELSEQTNVRLISFDENTPVYAFKTSKTQERKSVWELTENSIRPSR